MAVAEIRAWGRRRVGGGLGSQEFRGPGGERGPCARRRGVREAAGTVAVPRGAERAERQPLPAAASRGGAGPSQDGAAAQPRRVTRAGAARRGRRGRGVRGSGAHPRRIDIECDLRVARIAVSEVETGREPQTRPAGRLPRRRGGGCGWSRRSSDVRRRSRSCAACGDGPRRGGPPTCGGPRRRGPPATGASVRRRGGRPVTARPSAAGGVSPVTELAGDGDGAAVGRGHRGRRPARRKAVDGP